MGNLLGLIICFWVNDQVSFFFVFVSLFWFFKLNHVTKVMAHVIRLVGSLFIFLLIFFPENYYNVVNIIFACHHHIIRNPKLLDQLLPLQVDHTKTHKDDT